MLTEEIAPKIQEAAKNLESDMVKFLREMIAIPSMSGEEGNVIARIKTEMESVGFDEVSVDPMGNLLGRIGSGSTVIAMDGHIDTVDTGNINEWEWDPFEGKLEDGIIYGRGSVDMKGAMASMVYGGKIIKDLGLESDYTLYVSATVQEEDCDGLCWKYIIEEGGLRPDVVVISEPTNLNIYRGHRGRMEIGVRTSGVSCHGSAPERGENAIYKMAPIIKGIESLNERLKEDEFLGKGTICVTYIDCQTPSFNAVPDGCYIHLDRRLTAGEDKDLAINQVKDVLADLGIEGEVEMPMYETPSYTGNVFAMEKYFPTWTMPEDHVCVRSAVDAYTSVLGESPLVDKWTFSTNGIATAGLHDIPSIGFGPGNEIYAHAVSEQIPVEHLVKAAQFYAIFPLAFMKNNSA